MFCISSVSLTRIKTKLNIIPIIMATMTMMMIDRLYTAFHIHICSSCPDNHPEKYYLSHFALWKLRHKEVTRLAQGTPEGRVWSLGVSDTELSCLRTTCYCLPKCGKVLSSLSLLHTSHPCTRLFKRVQFVILLHFCLIYLYIPGAWHNLQYTNV